MTQSEIKWMDVGPPGARGRVRIAYGPRVDLKIERTPYGKTGFTFEAYERVIGASWERIPLAFSSRLRDVMEKAEKRWTEANA